MGNPSTLQPYLNIVTDVDECTLVTHNCDSKADCNNEDGSFTCACRSGYTGDGTSCTGKIHNHSFLNTFDISMCII